MSILNTLTIVVKKLNSLGVSFRENTDNDFCPDDLEYDEIDGHEVVIGDDVRRSEYCSSIRIKEDPDKILEILKSIFSEGESHPDTTTWRHNGVLVVFMDGKQFSGKSDPSDPSVQFFSSYEKVESDSDEDTDED